MSDTMHSFEYTQSGDPFLDYCLWEYEPVVSWKDKFRSINLLYHSFDVADLENNMKDLCESLRRALGDWKTVWGVKNVDGKLSWEFYFYDYDRLSREVSISRAIEVFRGYTKCELSINEDCLYFMFSIDVDNELVTGERELQEINVYLGDISQHVSAGICYRLNKNDLRLENLYHFFDAEREMDFITDKVVSSLHLTLSDFDIDKILMPEFIHCKTIVVANKKYNDGIYFSGINVNQLIIFLKMLEYPEKSIEFVHNNRDKLDHLSYDVGIDYRMVNGNIEFLKGSYYGVF